MSRGARWLPLAATGAAVAVVLLDTIILNVAGPTLRCEPDEIHARREEP